MTGQLRVSNLTSFWRKFKGSQSSGYVIYYLLNRVKNTDYRSKLNKSNCSVVQSIVCVSINDFKIIIIPWNLSRQSISWKKSVLMQIPNFTLRCFTLQIFTWPGMAGSVRSAWIWSQIIRYTSIHPHSTTNYFWLCPLV